MASFLISNLRHFRKLEPGEQLNEELLQLTEQAKKDLAWLKPTMGVELKDA